MEQKIKFDEVIELLGGFGKYQKRLYCMVVAPCIFCAVMTIIMVFTIGEQDYRCQIPELQNDSFDIQNEDHYSYINRTIPKASDGAFDKCHVITNTTNNITTTRTCDSWVYDRSLFKSTLVSEFDLVCDRTIYQSHASMAVFGGALVGSLIVGIIGDTFGRKIACCLSVTLMFGAHLGTAFVPNYYAFIACRFLGGFANIGYWNSALILGFEIAGPKARVWTGMLIELVWCLGEYLTVFIAYLVRDWRLLQLILAAPIGLFLVYWKTLEESPRWLLNKGRRSESIKIMSSAAKINGCRLPDDIFICDNEVAHASILLPLKKTITSKVMVIRLVILLFNWATINAGYYGLTINSGKIGGNVFVNFTVSVTMEVIAYILCMVFLDRIGRRAVHCSCMLLGGVACLCTIFPVVFGDSTHSWIVISLSMIGKLGISAAFADIYIFSAELFPTSIRSFVLGLSCIFGRLGSLASPYIADLGLLIESEFGEALPPIVFGAMMLASGVMALTLPETMNKKMPETFEDALALRRNTKADADNDEVYIELTKEDIESKLNTHQE